MPEVPTTPVIKEECILTISGRHVELTDPSPDAIEIHDIAVGLSRECRFSGQCRTFYSVAQHSVLASLIVPLEYALEALLHDATEAFIKDLPSPLKGLLPEYKRIERILDRTIRRKFELPETMSAPVREADRVLLATEKRDLMPEDSFEWPILEGIEPLSDRIYYCSSVRTMAMFLRRFEELTRHTPLNSGM